MQQRINRLRAELKERELDACLVTKIENVFYLSGFTGDTGALLISGDEAYFFADSRFTLQASQEATGFIVVPVERSFFASIAQFLTQRNWPKVGVEAHHLSVGNFQKLQKALNSKVSLEPLDQLVEKLRMIKEPAELAIMKEAVTLTEAAFNELLPLIKPGVTERYLQVQLIKLLYEAGFSGPSFDFIVASGERGALPHGVATDRTVNSGELITFDFGGVYNRYCSDMTRTIAVGEISPQLKEIYQIVHLAQDEAEKAARPGMNGRDLDAVSRQVIADSGYGDNFGHGLGHGVGLEIHELPAVSPRGEELLKPGMVITIEPGIYIAGIGGVRIENQLAITETGAEVWNSFNKDLLVL